MAVTWNPLDKSNYFTLTNGDLTAANTLGNSHVSLRATDSKLSGKWYWEIHIDNSPSDVQFIGIGTSSAVLNNRLGWDTNSYCYLSDGRKDYNNDLLSYGDSFVEDDIIGIALDLDNGKLYFSLNGVWQNSGDPVAGTGFAYDGISGTFFPMVSVYYKNDSFTARFFNTDCTYSSPTGFSYFPVVHELEITEASGLSDVITPDLLVETLAEAAGLSGVITPDLLVETLAEAAGLSGVITPDLLVLEIINAIGLSDTLSVEASLSILLAETIGLSDSVIPDLFVEILAETAGLNDTVDRDYYFYKTIAEAVGLNDVIGVQADWLMTLLESAGLADVIASFNWTQWLLQNEYKATKRYYLTLTGEDDDTTDIVIPMKSFQGRLRDGDPTYLSCVIPGAEYAAQINARSNGDLIVEMAYLIDGVEQYKEQLVIVDLETIRVDEGAKNQSITLSGHRTESFVTKEVILDGASYYYISGGKYHYRLAKVDMYLKPGDTVEVNGDSFTVDVVTYFVSVKRQQMEISE